MLLRPATPLSLIFLAAFVLLLLSTLSTPIIHAIPLATFQRWRFGVFGYCREDGSQCSRFQIGYSTDGLFTGQDADDFDLPSTARRSLSSILIVHPVAALFALICLGMAVAAHFRGPSHSPRYLLALLILTIPTLLITLLAFLVDILLFVPHMSWGGWIVLAATILIIASSVVTCAMRRTLVSRKARKKRIAENANMNGADYYDNLAQRPMVTNEQLPRAESPPDLDNGLADKSGPSFATFEMKSRDVPSQDGTQSRRSEDRTPLNPIRDPSLRSGSSGGGHRRPFEENVPPMPVERQYSSDSYGNGAPTSPVRDQYGNPIARPSLYHEGSQGSFGSNDGRRGRGSYPGPGSRGRGYGPPRGGYGAPPRGGYNNNMMSNRGGGYYPPRGGYGPPRGGQRGPPPPGWVGRGRGGYGPPPNMSPGYDGMPRQGPPPGYGNIIDQYSMPVEPETAPPHREIYDDASRLAIGQAIEMDERTGQASPQYGGSSRGNEYATIGPDGRVSESGHARMPSARDNVPDQADSEHNYVPARPQWATPPADELAIPAKQPDVLHATSPPIAAGNSSTHRRMGSEDYYEDVDPRFAIDPASDSGVGDHLPGTLTPGATLPGAARRMPSPNHLHPSYNNIPYTAVNTDDPIPPSAIRPDNISDENIPDGARSPGEGSETSHFTSISQRGVNPAWKPGYPLGGPSGGAMSSASTAQRRREDVILTTNPDFSLPGMGPRGRGASPLPRGAASSPVAGLTPAGRYPTEF